MEAWLFIQAMILGVVEGLTEFLPVSSTGHLIVVSDAIGFTGERAKTFGIFIQLGAIFGVVWHYRIKVWQLAAHLNRPAERRFALNLLIAFVPAAIAGLLLHSFIKAYLFTPVTVAAALIAGGIVILLIERSAPAVRVQSVDDVRPHQALWIGIAQMCALFPGVSRAGATIMGGLLTGLSRTAAAEFSFFLAIPTMVVATLFDLAKSMDHLQPQDVWLFAVGFITAFITALVVVRVFLAFIARHTFAPFAWYRIGFGALVLLYFW